MVNALAVILVDYEKVSASDGLKSVEYTGSLRAFGREDGRGIYQMLKSVV